MHDRIYTICEEILKEGTLTTEQMRNLEYLYRPYKKLGGNGTGKLMFEAVSELYQKLMMKERLV